MAEQATNIMPFPGMVVPGREQTVKLHQQRATAFLKLIGRTELLLGISAENTTPRALRRLQRRRNSDLTLDEITRLNQLTQSMDRLLDQAPTLYEVPEITRRLKKLQEQVIQQAKRQGMA